MKNKMIVILSFFVFIVALAVLYFLVFGLRVNIKKDIYESSLIEGKNSRALDFIIPILFAEHLDSSRKFISDIHDEVKELDRIWSEEIPEGHYVRIVFENPLDSSRDITIYPRIVSGNPRIEVYEMDEKEKIAEFSSLNSEQYNKVYLTDLKGTQDTFDLKVVGGSIQIDYVFDPAITFEDPPTPANNSFVNENAQTIVANISDTSNISSWIDFDRDLLLWLSLEGDDSDNSSYSWSIGDGGVTYSSAKFGQGATGFSTTNKITVDPDLDFASGNMTLSFWMYVENTAQPNRQNPIGKAYGGDGTFTVERSGYINFYFGSSGANAMNYTSDSSGGFENKTWNHWVITRDRTNRKTQWYKNGVTSGSVYSYSWIYDPVHSSNDLSIGDDYVNPLNGTLDEIMIFNRSLSSTEVKALYDSQSNKFNTSVYNLEEGKHNYTVYAINEDGSSDSSGERNFVLDTISPTLTWENPTPDNGSTENTNYLYLNLSSSDVGKGNANVSTFIDFNNSLVLWLRMDDVNQTGYGATVIDYTGNNNGTAYGNALQVSGVLGKAYDFNGYDYIELPASNALLPNETWTISSWFNPSSIISSTTGNRIITFHRKDTYGTGLSLLVGNNTKAIYRYYNSTGSSQGVQLEDVSLNTWHYFSASFNGTTHTVCLDGEITSIQDTFYGFGSFNAYIAAYYYDSSIDIFFNGSIDDVIFFNRSLSANELQALYANSSSKYLENNFTSLGYMNYTYEAYAQDSAGNVNSTGLSEVTLSDEDAIPPQITWEDPTPDPGETVTEDFVYLNTTITDESETSAWFDWNRGLVGYWSFEEYNDTGVFDNSSYGNFGVFVNSSVDNITSGARGNALQFSGGSSYVFVEGEALIPKNITLSSWVKTNYTGDWQGIISNKNGAGYGIALVLWTGTGEIRALIGNGTYYRYLTSDINAGNNEWYHIATTHNSETNITKLYVNGIYVNETEYYLGYHSSNNDFVIGAYYTHGTNMFGINGSVDEAMVFNRTLSDQEILALYNNTANRLYNNFTDLDEGNYTYRAYAIDEYGNLNITDEREVRSDNPSVLTECGTISSSGIYTLNKNLTSTGTCFTISAENVILDCNDYWINYSTGGVASTRGVYSNNHDNLTVKNCWIIDGNWTSQNTGRNGIYSQDSDNVVLYRNFINISNYYGIYLGNSLYSNVTENIAYSNASYGIVISNADNGTIKNNFGESNFLRGISISDSDNNLIISNNASSYATDQYCFYMSGQNNTITDNLALSYSYRGFLISVSNSTLLRNNGTTIDGSIGFYTNGDSNSFENNTAMGVSGHGFYIVGEHNTFVNNTGKSQEDRGFVLSSAHNNNFINNTATSEIDIAFFVSNSQNNTFIDNFARSTEHSAFYIEAGSSHNTWIRNRGISMLGGRGFFLYSNSENNTLTSNTFESNESVGFYFYNGANNNLAINNTAKSNFSIGFYSFNSSNNVLISLNSSGGIYGIRFMRTNYTNVSDCISILGGTYDVYIDSDAGSIENYFLNCSYDTEYIESSTNYLIRQWYYQAYVNYTNGTAVIGANVSAHNISDALDFTELTNGTGWISRQNITEYINTGGTKVYQNNYTIDASLSGYLPESHSFNFTLEQNKLDDFFTLGEDGNAPQIIWEDPTPDPGETVTDDFVYLNTTITDESETSAWFDWNRSLVGYWSMDYYNSTHVYDNSSYGNFGTLGTDSKEPTWTNSGYFGGAYSFDDDYIDFQDDENFDFIGNFSISVWIKTSQSSGTYPAIAGKGFLQPNSNGYGIFLLSTDSYNASFQCRNGATISTAYSNIFVNDDEWHHIVGVRDHDNEVTYIYVDGIEGTKNTGTSLVNYSNSLKFGLGLRDSGVWSYPFNGLIDEVILFNRSLSQEEILALYNNTANRLFNNFTDLEDGTYNYSAYAIDEYGNLNITDEREVIIYGADTTFPYFTSIPENDSITYGDDWNGVDFDAEDETEFDSYLINDTRFTINSTGFLDDITILGAGNYSINVTINDTSNNLNWTIYTLTVNKATPTGSISGTSPILYGTAADVEGSEINTGDSDLIYELYREGTNVSNPDTEVLNIGSYNYIYNTTGGQNYSSSAILDTFDLIVNEVPETRTFLGIKNSRLTLKGGNVVRIQNS